MLAVDLTDFSDDSFVLYFGGRSHEVDAHSFGHVLILLAEAAQAINQEINPGFSLEVAIDAVGPGSFRAKLKTSKKSLRNLFSADIPKGIIIGLLSSFIYEKMRPQEPPEITINDDSVIIQHGSDRIIVSRETYEAKERVNANPVVNRNVGRVMETLENDSAIDSFGIARALEDTEPLFEVPRALFQVVRSNIAARPEVGRRAIKKNVVISVHKAIFDRSTRKWEFIWDGFRISAPILDQTFFDRLEAREISITQGDAFDAVLRIHQTFESVSGNWLNESYEVISVGARVSRRPDQQTAIH